MLSITEHNMDRKFGNYFKHFLKYALYHLTRVRTPVSERSRQHRATELKRHTGLTAVQPSVVFMSWRKLEISYFSSKTLKKSQIINSWQWLIARHNELTNKHLSVSVALRLSHFVWYTISFFFFWVQVFSYKSTCLTAVLLQRSLMQVILSWLFEAVHKMLKLNYHVSCHFWVNMCISLYIHFYKVY